jgi:tripartite-type tricarboxylate transporter receptor subunit TctC
LIAAAMTLATAPDARSQAYPSQTITIILPFSAGTGIDLASRVFAEKLSQRLGQAVVLENRPGAGGNMGHAAAAKANPDGYTLLMAANTLAMNTSLYHLSFDALTSFEPVSLYAKGAMVLIVNQAVKAKTLGEFLALAKASPGKLNYSTPGIGTPQHLAMELLKLKTGIDIVHIPHRGAAEAVMEVVRGGVEATFAPIQSALPHIHANTVRALAVSSPRRHPVLPQTPTVSEALGGQDFDVDLWYGLFAPARTPQPIVEKLNHEVAEILRLPDVQDKLQKVGMLPYPSTASELSDLFRADSVRWANVIKAAHIKAQ